MKNYDLTTIFKTLFYIGITFLFTSMFLYWYSFEVSNSEGALLASWNYNPFTEWTTTLSKDSEINTLFRPENLGMPLVINLLYIGLMLFSVYTITFKDISKESEDLQKLQAFSSANMFLGMVCLYYIVIFPYYYIIGNDLYFPSIVITDEKTNLTYSYMVGPGYWCQIFGLVCIFPYVHHYQKTIKTFVLTQNSEMHEARKVSVDIDKSIAEEELKQKGVLLQNQDIQSEIRKRKKVSPSARA